jgi:uncharacterized protein
MCYICNMLVENPFLIRGYIAPEYFCNREKETQLLVDAAINGRDITLFSIRRLGKTGLIENAAYTLKKEKGYAYIYSDIYNTENIEELVNTLTIQVMLQLFSKQSLLQKIGSFFKHIAPIISFDSISGSPEVSFKFNKTADAFHTLDELFTIVNQHPKPVYWAWDEFQQINLYENPSSVLKHLRTLIQKSSNIRFVFSGSHSNMLISIFNDAKQPFYKSTQLKELKEIEPLAYSKFILKHFKKAKKTIDTNAIDYILEQTMLHTWYTQMLCNRLFQQYSHVTLADVKIELINILEEMEITFYRFRQILPRGQWELLKAVGKEEKVFKPTANEFMQSHHLKGSASVLLALKKLINDEFIVEQYENDMRFFRLSDVFLIRWIQWKFQHQ